MPRKTMLSKKFLKVLLTSFSLLMLICFTFVLVSHAQNYWTPLPPYNTLWPLWSPALSPLDDAGVPVPLVTSLAPGTVLPVQPGLTWDPSVDYPWLLYNTPVGMAYFDPLYGVNYWPPSNFLDADGLAVPLLFDDPFVDPGPPTDPLWLQQNVLFGNSYFLNAYPAFLATANPQLFATATPYPLPPNIIAALELGLTIPTLGTTLYPPPGILEFLTPAGLLGW